MGCGQSKIHLYPRKSRSKANGKKRGHGDSDAETDDDEGHTENLEKLQNRERNELEEELEVNNKDTNEPDDEVAVSLLRAKNLSLLQNPEISTSQQNFFRMLDKKIEEGPDYDSNSETEIALEEARLNALVQHWESVSLTASICSSASRSLQTTPVRTTPAKQLTITRSMLSTGFPTEVHTTELLPHSSTPIGSDHLTSSTFKLTSNKQMVPAHMNSGMLHQLAALPQMPHRTVSDGNAAVTNVTTLNSNASNSLNKLQTSNTQQPYLLTIPTGSSPLLPKSNQFSPKRLVDGHMLMNSSPLIQQVQSSPPPPPTPPTNLLQSQYLPATPNLQTTANINYMNGGRTTQPNVTLQLAYYGHTPTAQTNIQQTVSQQLQQYHEQNLQSQNQTLPISTISTPAFYNDNAQYVQASNNEYRFPPAISVQRLAPQVQRQLRETQELIKDSCPSMYTTSYGSPGPPQMRHHQTALVSRTLPTNRRPTLETQFSQELS